MAKQSDETAVAMLALRPDLVAIIRDLSPRKLIALSKEPRFAKLAEYVLFGVVVRLARGEQVSEQLRLLIDFWAMKKRIQPQRKRVGRPSEFEKELLVGMAYRRKIEKDPKRKSEAIVAELEREFGLKRRRVLEIIKLHKDLEQDLERSAKAPGVAH